MLTVPEAAAELRVSANHLYNLCARGDVPHRRLGRRVLIPRAVVLDLCGLTPAAPDLPRGSAAAGGESGTGAAGPRDNGVLGEVHPTVGSSASGRPAAPTTKKARPVAAGRAKNNAG